MVDVLQGHARTWPERRVLTFLEDGEREAGHLTFRELDRQARAVAGWLQSQVTAGERVVLLFPEGLAFVSAFFGCLYAGVIAVPAPPPEPARLQRTLPRVASIVDNARPALILTTAEIRARQEMFTAQAPVLARPRWVDVGTLLADAPAEAWRPLALEPDAVAYLQYTSGSTSAPKGVMVTHRNLAFHVGLIREGWRLGGLDGPQQTTVMWVPNFHDDGLVQGIVHPLNAGMHCVRLPAMAVAQKPMRWLRAISRYRAIHSGGPNFGYALAVRKLAPEPGLDLSSWEIAYNGAEPIRSETLEEFHRTFAPYGFRWGAFSGAYGMAEATLLMAIQPPGRDPLVCNADASILEREGRVVPLAAGASGGRALVGCGPPLGDMDIAIVDPATRRRLDVGQVGEIWIANPSVARGYWEHPEATEEIFAARIADTGEGPYLRTGDLGFFWEGELFIAGRKKDLIIIRGRNVYPQDVELCMEKSHAAIREGCCAAFSVDAEGQERLVVAAEVRDPEACDGAAVIAAIRQGISQEHELQVYAVCLLAPGGVHKTSSGKIQRQGSRKAFIEGTLQAIARWQLGDAPAARAAAPAVAAPPLRAWMIGRVAQVLGVDAAEIDARQPLARYGLDSASAVALVAELEERLGRALAPTLLFEYPDIERLSRHLAGDASEPESGRPAGQAAAATAAPPVIEATGQASGQPAREAEPIAIIGLGCRFPGAADPDAFWDLLARGDEAIGDVPPDRWDAGAFYDPSPDRPGTTCTRQGGFLARVDLFDAAFFEISPREAASMDPQQRLLLEVAWEALAQAGLVPEALAGTAGGVFIGASSWDYSQLQRRDPRLLGLHAGTGTALSIAANRISYLLDWHGPSMVVDTACSSALVAVHLACRSLRSGESSLALAGGVNLVLAPEGTIALSQGRMLAPDGRCKPFDARADGYGRGEGCGVVVLKRLADARRDGDRVLALVRGTAVNQDGRSNGLTAPNGRAHRWVVQQALRDAGVAPAAIDYVEAHGTGTALGDAIEVQALAQVLGQGRPASRPLVLGSAKANIGHLEAAAGMAGLIKVVLALHHERIPLQLGLETVNPHIRPELDAGRVAIPVEAWPWPASARPRLAGVNAFGFGGTNAHVIVEEARAGAPEAQAGAPAAQAGAAAARAASPGAVLLPLSARDAQALRDLAGAYQGFLARSDEALADICYTAGVRRAHHELRLAVVGEDARTLGEALAAFVRGAPHPGVIVETGAGRSAPTPAGHAPGIAGAPAAGVAGDRGARVHALARLYAAGQPVPWDALYPHGGRVVDLPAYPWQRRRHWLMAAVDPGAPAVDILAALRAEQPQDRGGRIAEHLRVQLSQTLGIDAAEVPLARSLSYLGLDSLMAMELKKRIERDFGLSLPVTEFRRGTTLDALATRIAERLASDEALQSVLVAAATDGDAEGDGGWELI